MGYALRFQGCSWEICHCLKNKKIRESPTLKTCFLTICIFLNVNDQYFEVACLCMGIVTLRREALDLYKILSSPQTHALMYTWRFLITSLRYNPFVFVENNWSRCLWYLHYILQKQQTKKMLFWKKKKRVLQNSEMLGFLMVL